jgi:hypothetical protein
MRKLFFNYSSFFLITSVAWLRRGPGREPILYHRKETLDS